MQPFEFYSPTQIVFGPDTETQVGKLVRAHGGNRVLVVYGGQSALKSGLLSRVLRSLEEAGLSHLTLGGVQPNPRLSLARKGISLAIEEGVDFLLAVGGGSVIDTAKSIAHGAANPDTDIWQFFLKKATVSTTLPVGVVLTISAAGSECSDSAVLTNEETGEKRGLTTDLQRPRFAIMNPMLTATLPTFQLTCGVVDIMMHTLDRYFNPVTTNELTDEFAEGLLRTAIRNGRRALAQPGDYQALSELMWCGSLSHNGLTGLGGQKCFAPHQLGHELSAMFDVAHGASLSAVWDSWARYSMDADPARFARYGQKVWGLNPEGKTTQELALESIETTAAYFRELGMPTCLSELGCGVLTQEQIEELTHRCTFYGTRTIGTYKVLGREDIRAIYTLANR